MTEKDRYDVSERVEGQFEPGSNGLVAKNRLGIVSSEEMDRVEAAALVRVTEEAVHSFDAEHRFTVVDVRALHRSWLGEIYEWAGEYRQVNVGKGGSLFAAADRIPTLMEELEAGALRRNTPCKSNEIMKIALTLAEIHVELVLIHPFRDGKGSSVPRLCCDCRRAKSRVFRCSPSGNESELCADECAIRRNYSDDYRPRF